MNTVKLKPSIKKTFKSKEEIVCESANTIPVFTWTILGKF